MTLRQMQLKLAVFIKIMVGRSQTDFCPADMVKEFLLKTGI